MKFFSLEDSKKLAEMGCKSDGWYYVYSDYDCLEMRPTEGLWRLTQIQGFKDKTIMAFTAYDFLGDSEQARRNCEILWGDQKWRTTDKDGNPQWKNEIENVGPVWKFRRTQMLSSPDHIEFVKGFLR